MSIQPAGRALICGSLAFDTIMVFADRFANHILADRIHMLNVSFLVPQMRREYGGCAGNIAYNLRLLGDSGYPMATVRRDFGPYREWLRASGCRLITCGWSRRSSRRRRSSPPISMTNDPPPLSRRPGAMAGATAEPCQRRTRYCPGSSRPTAARACDPARGTVAEAGIPFIFDGAGPPMSVARSCGASSPRPAG
jgi:adenosine kinase